MLTQMGQNSSGMSRTPQLRAALALSFGLLTATQAAAQTDTCGPSRQAWERLVAANATPQSMVDAYRTIPRACVAERAEALLTIGQKARQAGLLLEADSSGSPIITRLGQSSSSPASPSQPVTAIAPSNTPIPGTQPPSQPLAGQTSTLVLTDADIIAAPTARDQQNPPPALTRLQRDTVVTLSGTLMADGRFSWSLLSEQPQGSGLTTYAMRLADRYRARTVRPDGASLVGAQWQRTFRFRPNS